MAEADDGDELDIDDLTASLAQKMDDELSEAMPDLAPSMWSDLLTSAWQSVDWFEIAGHWLEHQHAQKG